MKPIREIGEMHGIRIVDDAAQAHGASYAGNPVGSLADATAFSFYPTKNLGAFGDGGAVTTNDPTIYERIKMLRNYGESRKYFSEVIGFNSRLDELQAAILTVKLKHLEEINWKKRKIAKRYLEEINSEVITLPFVPSYSSPVWHQFVVRTPKRNKLKTFLAKRGIETLVHYPIPPHLQPAYSGSSIVDQDKSVSAKIANEILSIPIHWLMDDQSVSYVVENINDFLR